MSESPNEQEQCSPGNGEGSPRSRRGELHVWEYRWVRDLLIVAAILFVFWAAYKASAVTVPILIGLALAYVVDPLVTWAQRNARIPRAVSAATIMLCFVIAVTGVLFYVLPLLVYQANALQKNGQVYIQRAAESLGIDVKEELRRLKEEMQRRHEASGESRFLLDSPEGIRQRVYDRILGGDEDAKPQPEEAKEREDDPTKGAESDEGGGSTTTPDETSGPTSAGTDTPVAAGTGEAGDTDQPQPRASGTGGEAVDSATAEAEGKGILSRNPLAGSNERDAEEMSNLVKTLVGLIMRAIGVVVVWMVNMVFSVFELLAYIALLLLVVAICFFYFTWKFDPTIEWFKEFIPEKYKERTLDVTRRMDRAVSQWLRGRLIQSFFVALILSTGWALVGVNYWLLLGIAGGLLNLIPYAAGLVWPIAVLVAWAETITTGQSFSWLWVVIAPSIVYIVAQSVDGWVVEPIVQGQATELNAVVVLLAVLIGGTLAGFFGMLLAIPLCACLKILMDDVVMPQVRAYLKHAGTDEDK